MFREREIRPVLYEDTITHSEQKGGFHHKEGKGRRMSTMQWWQGVFAGLILLMIVGFGTSVFAGGGVNHKVTIRNNTDRHCGARLYYGSNLFGTVKDEFKEIPANESRTYETGSKCPLFIEGGCSRGWAGMPSDNFSRCTSGVSASGASSCGITCWSSDWFIKTRSGYDVELTKE